MNNTRMSALALAMVLVIPVTQAAGLRQSIAESIDDNPVVQRALKSFEAVTEEVREAQAGYYPTIDATLGYGYEWTKTSGSSDEELNRREVRLNVNQMIFDGGATGSEVERQEARMRSAIANLWDVSEDYVLEAGRAYLELLRREQLLNSANETLLNHVKIYEQIKRRSESGMGSLSSIQQAEGRLALAEVNALAAENNMRDAKANYERIFGLAPQEQLDAVDAMIAPLPATLEAAQALSATDHPVMSVAQADIEAAVAQREAAESRMYPRLDLEIERRWDDNLDGQPGPNEDLTAMLRLRYNLYNGGEDSARIRRSEHQLGEAQAIQRDAMRQVRQSLELSWNAYEILGRQMEFLSEHLSASQQTRDAYQKQFDIGQRTLLDLLDTENEVFSARNQLVEAQIDHQIAQMRVLNATGGLLSALNIPLPQPQADAKEQASMEQQDAQVSG
jgi:adhesin transport system outer membrane protein